MSTRHSRFALLVTLAALATACSSASDAPPVQEPAGTPKETFATPTATATATNNPPPPVNDYDAGPALPPPVVTGTGTAPPPVTPGPPVACPTGEVEAEPNDSASPNALNSVRCGVLTPGDTDVLVVNLQAFNISWTGAVNVTASQPVLNGPYHLTIVSQTPSVNTAWEVTLKP